MLFQNLKINFQALPLKGNIRLLIDCELLSLRNHVSANKEIIFNLLEKILPITWDFFQSSQIGIYEEIRKSRKIKLYEDDDLTVGTLFKEGRYSLMYKGFLSEKEIKTAVLIKFIHSK